MADVKKQTVRHYQMNLAEYFNMLTDQNAYMLSNKQK